MRSLPIANLQAVLCATNTLKTLDSGLQYVKRILSGLHEVLCVLDVIYSCKLVLDQTLAMKSVSFLCS